MSDAGTPEGAADAAMSGLIRRILLSAWYDLKWYRVNSKEHPNRPERTIEAIEAALATPEPQARQPEGDA